MKLIIKTIISKLLNKPGKSLRKRYLHKQNNHYQYQKQTRQPTKHNQATQQYKQNQYQTKSNRKKLNKKGKYSVLSTQTNARNN